MTDSDDIFFDNVEKMECPSCHAEADVSTFPAFSQVICPTCGATLTVPGRLDKYLLLSCIGRGGMGSVYRAYDETLDRIVAIKIMRQSLGLELEFLESFRREAQAAAKLNHPNIAQIYSFGEENGQPYIVMEYVPGKHLDKMIESTEPLSQPMIMKIGMDIADGLQLAAASNLIHGDIKPDNILLDDRDQAKLVDFGLATSPDIEQTEVWGTSYYIAPEKVKRERADFRSDMYSLGGTLYHALTKLPPFDGEDAVAVAKARLLSPPRPLREIRSDIDPEVERIVMKMLEADPDKRYHNYGELIEEIRKYLARVQPNSNTQNSGSGGASKRIIIKSRNSTKSIKSSPTSQFSVTDRITTQNNDTGTHKAIHITKTSTRKSPLLGAEDMNLSVYENGIDDSDGNGASHGKKSKIGRGIVTGIVIVAVIVIAGAVGFTVSMNKKKEKELNALIDYVANQNVRLRNVQNVFTKTQNFVNNNVSADLAKANEILAAALALTEREVGPEFNAAITEELPFEPVVFEDRLPDEENEEPSEEAEEAKDGGTTEKEEVIVEDGAEVVTEDGAEATEGEEAGAVAEEVAESESAEAATDEVTMDEVAAEATDEEVPVAEDGAVTDLPEEEVAAEPALEGLPAQAREIFVILAPVRQSKQIADATLSSVLVIYDKCVGSTNITNKVSIENTAKVKDEIDSNIKRIDKWTTLANERYNYLKDAAAGNRKAISEAKDKLDALTTAAEKAKIEREQIAANEKAAEEARIAMEKKAAEEAARKAAEEAEIAKVKGMVPTYINDITAHKYDSVLRKLNDLESELKFKTAKDALKTEIRRVEGLKNLKAFLIAQLAANKYTNPAIGWSVVSVDDRKVEIQPKKKGAKSQKVSWHDLKPMEQIVPFIVYYLNDAQKVADRLRLRERTDAYINAAIYFMTFAGGDERAKAAAKQYCIRAMNDMPSQKNDIKEILYEIDFSDVE